MSQREEQSLTLPDGRTLGYAEYGAPGGPAVLVCHGWPSSRLSGRRGRDAATRLGVRLIAPDRPGYGLSSPAPGRGPQGWVEDAVALLDALGVEQCAVVGTSGGGPFACAVAQARPERVRRLGLIAALAPVAEGEVKAEIPWGRRVMYGAARVLPWGVDLVLRQRARGVQADPARAIGAVIRRLPPPDRVIAKRPEIRVNLVDDYAEAFRQGHVGAAADAHAIVRRWGFSPSQIEQPAFVWQGERDGNVPPGMGHYYARALPRCEARFIPEAGHLWALDHMDEVLTALVE